MASFNAPRNSSPSFKPRRLTRWRTSSIRCSVASMPISLVSSTVSSSSYRSSSILPPPNTLASDLAICWRDLLKPCRRRAAQPSAAGCSGAGSTAAWSVLDGTTDFAATCSLTACSLFACPSGSCSSNAAASSALAADVSPIACSAVSTIGKALAVSSVRVVARPGSGKISGCAGDASALATSVLAVSCADASLAKSVDSDSAAGIASSGAWTAACSVVSEAGCAATSSVCTASSTACANSASCCGSAGCALRFLKNPNTIGWLYSINKPVYQPAIEQRLPETDWLYFQVAWRAALIAYWKDV